MSNEPESLKHSLQEAIAAAEAGAVQRRKRMRAVQEERDRVMARIVDLHDDLLRLLRSGGANGGHQEVQEAATVELGRLVDELREVVAERDLRTLPHVAVADASAGRPVQQEAVFPAERPEEEAAGRVAAEARRGDEQAHEPVDTGSLLKPIYQEILTLQENEDLFERQELRLRVQLLLARMREIQDGPLGGNLTEQQRAFMTTRFGLLEKMQKHHALGYMNELNRRHRADWSRVVDELSRGLEPLADRIQAIHEERDRDEARRRAAQEMAARRRMEGEEILDEIRLFVRSPDLRSRSGQQRFRHLVGECVACLGTDNPDLLDVVEPYGELLEGREFKSLRKAFRRARERETPRPQEAPRPSSEADHEELLAGSWTGRRALIAGGMRREKAETIIRDHLGLEALVWLPAHELNKEGPGRAEELLESGGVDLLVILEDVLGEGLLERLSQAGAGAVVVRVQGGQEIGRILSRIPVEGAPAGNGLGSVNDALQRVLQEHPNALIPAFNSASRWKDYPYEDPEAVYKALKFLATTYRDARAGRSSCPDLDMTLRSLCGFQYRGHQAASTMGRYQGSYEASYKGRRYELEEHVGRGINRDPRYSIRIAFTYLPEEDAVLLGYLGQHQRTTVS